MSLRVVSLLPSSTEIVVALGCTDHLVGRSHSCDFPESIQTLPVCTTPKFDIVGTSAIIDQRVTHILEQGLSVYRVDGALLKQLQPSVIITQCHCEVCAVSLDEVMQATQMWLDYPVDVVALSPNGLDDVFDDIVRVAQALDVVSRGQTVIHDLRDQMATLAQQTRDLMHKPIVALIEWLDPLMFAGNWMPTLVDMAGGINLFGQPNAHSHYIDWQAILHADPDVIVLLPCGYPIDRTLQEIDTWTRHPDYASLQAVHTQQVYVVDGHHYFNRPGPRLVDALKMLAEILHPSIFSFGYHHHGWIQLHG